MIHSKPTVVIGLNSEPARLPLGSPVDPSGWNLLPSDLLNDDTEKLCIEINRLHDVVLFGNQIIGQRILDEISKLTSKLAILKIIRSHTSINALSTIIEELLIESIKTILNNNCKIKDTFHSINYIDNFKVQFTFKKYIEVPYVIEINVEKSKCQDLEDSIKEACNLLNNSLR